MATGQSTQEETLNGLHPAKLEEVVESLKDDDNLTAFSGPWRSRVVWEDGFKAKALMRTHTVRMDEPDGLDTDDTAAAGRSQSENAL
ncbi:MAG: hypothetical protein ACE5EV_02120, partial [Gaiellales bacterium]